MSLLNIRKDDCELDFLSLGALIHRLDPGVIPFRKARAVEIHVSGGEYNVAAGLSDCFGLNTGIASAMVDYPIGELVESRVREMGVKPYFKRFGHNGVDGPNIATVYSDRGYGVRPPVVFYNRANEAGAMLKAGDFDWDEIFGRGVRWFHSGGIYAALSATTSGLIIEAMQAAKKHGAITSFDLNYRPKLWAPIGGLEQARKTFRAIVEHVDVLLGNEEDLQLGLGIAGPGRGVFIQAGYPGVPRHDRPGYRRISERPGRGDDAARSGEQQPPPMGRRGLVPGRGGASARYANWA